MSVQNKRGGLSLAQATLLGGSKRKSASTATLPGARSTLLTAVKAKEANLIAAAWVKYIKKTVKGKS